MWQYLVKAAIGSIIMKSKPIKKMVKRFMRGAVKKLGKTAGTLIGGAALMIMGGYATNGAYGFGKGFFGGVEGVKQAKSAFDLIGRAKDAFSTAGSEMSSFTEFLKGGVDKVTGNAETGTDLGTGFVVETADVSTDPTIGFTDAQLRGDALPLDAAMPEVVATATQADVLAARSSMIDQVSYNPATGVAEFKDFRLTNPDTKEGMMSNIDAIRGKMGMINPNTPTGEINPEYQAYAELLNDQSKNLATLETWGQPPATPVLAEAAPVDQPWYKKSEQWLEDNPKTTNAIYTGLGLLAGQPTPPAYGQSPMMMGMGGYEGYGTSQTEAWRAYAPESVSYSVDNQLNPNSYINYMSALG